MIFNRVTSLSLLAQGISSLRHMSAEAGALIHDGPTDAIVAGGRDIADLHRGGRPPGSTRRFADT